jgi:hypothetical protein
MKIISEFMLGLMERFSLSTKGITDAAQLETYVRQFNSQKENYL